MDKTISSNENNRAEEKNIEKAIIDLVVARLRSIPKNATLSLGDSGTLNVEDMIRHVMDNDEEGKAIVQSQLDYLRSLKDLPLDIGV